MKQAMKIISVFLIVIGCSFCTSFPSFQKDTNFLMPKTEINTICSLSKEPTKIKIEEKPDKKEEKNKEENSKILEEKKVYSNQIKILVTEEERKEIGDKVNNLENEIIMISKVIYREAGGISDFSHRAAVAWCILNRVDSEKYGNSIEEVITSPYQFAWIENTPVEEDNYNIAKDVVTRWILEKKGIEEVGRVLPSDYYFFIGDGQYNYFKQTIDSNYYWDWSYETPY